MDRRGSCQGRRSRSPANRARAPAPVLLARQARRTIPLPRSRARAREPLSLPQPRSTSTLLRPPARACRWDRKGNQARPRTNSPLDRVPRFRPRTDEPRKGCRVRAAILPAGPAASSPHAGGSGRASRRPPVGVYVVRPASLAASHHHSLGLFLGDGQRDVQGVGRGLGLYAGPRQVDVPLLDRIAQAADTVDLDLDDVPWLHGPGVRRGAGKDHVAWLERDQTTQIGELVGDAEDHVLRAALLYDLTVQVGA